MKNKIVAVNGNPEYCQELVDTLIDMGGVNLQGLTGKNEGCLYYIDPDSKTIMSEFDNEITSEEFDVITLQELKKQLMELKPIQKINLDEGNYSEEVEIELGNDHEVIERDGKFIIVKKKFPYTYKECCETLNVNYCGELQFDCDETMTHYENEMVDTLETFRKLIICRDAYWKVLNWTPNWEDPDEERVLISYDYMDNVIKRSSSFAGPFLLVFPDESSADIFIKKFGDLIEKCKDWL